MRIAAPTALCLALGACSGSVPDYQAVRTPYVDKDDVSPGDSVNQVIDVLQAAGASNIVVAHGLSASGGLVLDAIAADRLGQVYMFAQGRHTFPVKIPHDPGRLPVHPTIKILTAGKGTDAIMLVADVVKVKGKQSGMLATFGPDGVKGVSVLPLEALADKHGGMRDPYIGGTDLASGVLLTARGVEGDPWPVIYVISLAGKKIEVDEVPRSEGYKCTCFADWIAGKDGRLLFGEVIGAD